MSDNARIGAAFRDRFGTIPRIYSAPGRINLIGEHTDYNEGLVLPMAIDRRTSVAAAVRDDQRVRCYSTAFPGQIEFRIAEDLRPADDWGNHIRGVAACLARRQFAFRGADLLIESDVPVGAGLGSSAALGVVVAYALLSLSDEVIDLIDIAETAQAAEHEFAGTRCGIMDQYIACLGVEGHALLIDCRNLDYRAVPIGSGDPQFVICDTMVRHNLATSEYNARRAECESGVGILRSQRSDIAAMRDVTLEELDWAKDLLPESVYKRCRHVISENERTKHAAQALEEGNFAGFGRLMLESHESLRVNYEVSCRELDLLVEIATEIDGVFGTRMTGGGFGGCTVNLVAAEGLEEFEQTVVRRYHEECGVEPSVSRCRAAGGVREETARRGEVEILL